MKVTAKIVSRFTEEGRLKGIATVCLNGSFLVTGVRIVECERGLAVFMPSRLTTQNEHKDICFPCNPKLHNQIRDIVLQAFVGGE